MLDISIVIPVFQAETTIARAIQSALSLEDVALEVLVIDDGSGDQTGIIVAQIAATDTRVRLISQSNMGRSAARGAGIAAARGKWIMFLDADDYLLPGTGKVLAGYAQRDSLDLAVFSYRQVGTVSVKAPVSANKMSHNLVLSSHDVLEEMLAAPRSSDRMPADVFELNAVWARLYRAERLRELHIVSLTGEWCPFPVGLRFSEDRLLNIAYLASGEEFSVWFCPHSVYCWDLGESQTCGVARPDDIGRIDSYRCYCDDLVRASLISSTQANRLFTLELTSQFQRAVCRCDAPTELLAKSWKHALTAEGAASIDVTQLEKCPPLRKWIPGIMLIKQGLTASAIKSYRALYGAKKAMKRHI
ncbi:glycosyltransferase family 2 protein [Paratractidigestivibacter sp.]|uniref:glycosyltransferase family 2 protein n=1 Tax=Paratractidigestivibacter sp. TaxID=2847316 RepID=UPI002AC9C10E|nr:glycosyltransferase family 2 protein [Paratractidigestivibacter sp.]